MKKSKTTARSMVSLFVVFARRDLRGKLMSSWACREPEAGAEAHEIQWLMYSPAVAAWTADGGALALSLDDIGGVSLGDAARGGCDLRSAGDDVGVVGLGLGDHSASLTVVGLRDSGVAGGNAGLGRHVRLGLSDYSCAGLDIINQDCSGDD